MFQDWLMLCVLAKNDVSKYIPKPALFQEAIVNRHLIYYSSIHHHSSDQVQSGVCLYLLFFFSPPFFRLSHSSLFTNYSTWPETKHCYEISGKCCYIHLKSTRFSIFFSLYTSVVESLWSCECRRDWKEVYFICKIQKIIQEPLNCYS